ncbi:hypothetical protein ACHAQH_003962 [Verticillium albo-atrum]
MYATRLIHLLLVTLGFIAVAQAISPNIDGSNENAVVRRQDDTETVPSVASDAPTVAEPSTSPSTAAEQETTTAAETTTQSEAATTTPPSTTAPSTTPAASTPTASENGGGGDASTTAAPSASPSAQQSSPTTSAQDNNNNNNDNTESGDNQTTASEEAQTTAEPVTSTIKTVFVTTNAQGEETSMTSESVVVSTPGLSAEDNNGDSGGGMPTKTRNIVIGVVVGVGGAIILGALAFVGFRIYNRKKRHEENDGLMDYNTAGTSAFPSEPKSDAMSGTTAANNNNNRSPFQTNLESYHQPTQVNASSNF